METLTLLKIKDVVGMRSKGGKNSLFINGRCGW